jgi:hypothetical protein
MFNLKKSKRLMLIYVTIALWLGMGVLGSYYGTSYISLSVYFLALTGFIASYIWGESVRPARSSSILKVGKNSSREILIYICVLIWTALGAFGIVKGAVLEELATYYSVLTPFVGAYILGVTYSPTKVGQDSAEDPNAVGA